MARLLNENALSFNSEKGYSTVPASAKGMEQLVRLGIAREVTGRKRNRVFAYERYLAVLNEEAVI